MNRLTKVLDNNSYVVCDTCVQHNEAGYTGDVVEKLAKFENVYEYLVSRQNEIAKELDKLKLEGKTHTVKFKQLLAEKLTNNNILVIFETYGLKKEG